MIVILGIVVVGGALFLILSNVKFPKGRRLRGGGYGFGFGGFDGFGAFQDGNQIVPFGDGQQPEPGQGEGEAGAQGDGDREDDGKVLFIFGSGEREERSLNEDDEQDE